MLPISSSSIFVNKNFVQHDPLTIAIDCNGFSLLIFEEKWPNYAAGPKFAPNSYGCVNCLWLVDVTLIFDGIPSSRCQVAALRWPNDISSAADNAIFKNRAQNIECSFGYVVRSAVLLKPNVANILLFNKNSFNMAR